jgi:hypothetical protein
LTAQNLARGSDYIRTWLLISMPRPVVLKKDGGGVSQCEECLGGVSKRTHPILCDARGKWIADYLRLRFEAHPTRRPR